MYTEDVMVFKYFRHQVQWKTVEMSLTAVNKTYMAHAGK